MLLRGTYSQVPALKVRACPGIVAQECKDSMFMEHAVAQQQYGCICMLIQHIWITAVATIYTLKKAFNFETYMVFFFKCLFKGSVSDFCYLSPSQGDMPLTT